MSYQKRKSPYFLFKNTVQATLSAVSVSLHGEDAQYRISQTKDRQPMAIHSRGHSLKNETCPAKFSLQTDPTTRTPPVTNFAMYISFLATKPCHNSAQCFVFISGLHFSAANQKHYNMIICFLTFCCQCILQYFWQRTSLMHHFL
jgi:hypothetical protein